jgi:hypothetical protein
MCVRLCTFPQQIAAHECCVVEAPSRNVGIDQCTSDGTKGVGSYSNNNQYHVH